MTNTLAYCNTVLITGVKSFMVQTLVLFPFFGLFSFLVSAAVLLTGFFKPRFCLKNKKKLVTKFDENLNTRTDQQGTLTEDERSVPGMSGWC